MKLCEGFILSCAVESVFPDLVKVSKLVAKQNRILIKKKAGMLSVSYQRTLLNIY